MVEKKKREWEYKKFFMHNNNQLKNMTLTSKIIELKFYNRKKVLILVLYDISIHFTCWLKIKLFPFYMTFCYENVENFPRHQHHHMCMELKNMTFNYRTTNIYIWKVSWALVTFFNCRLCSQAALLWAQIQKKI